MKTERRPSAIDLFCGAGGMSLGFEQAGFDIIAAFDNDRIHVETHNKNFPNCETHLVDLSKVTGEDLRKRSGLQDSKLDVVFGGPPCGGFSLMGRRDPGDGRNELLLHFARLVSELSPSYFVVENVQGLNTGDMRSYLEDFERYICNKGYLIIKPINILNAYDYGVPQRRKRLFIIGYKNGMRKPEYPSPSGNGYHKHPNVWDAISDLAVLYEREELLSEDVYTGKLASANNHYANVLRGELKDPNDKSYPRENYHKGISGCGRVKHSSDVIERFNRTNQGEQEKISKYHRLSKYGESNTLRAGTDNSRGSYSAARPIHPIQPRCITVREGARLHSFPDWFEFHKTKWHGFRQVGNSVPPLLARAIASQIIELIE